MGKVTGVSILRAGLLLLLVIQGSGWLEAEGEPAQMLRVLFVLVERW